MINYARIFKIHIATVALLATCAVCLNLLIWSMPPDDYPSLWNVIFRPILRIGAAIFGVYCVLYGGTSPVVWYLLARYVRNQRTVTEENVNRGTDRSSGGAPRLMGVIFGAIGKPSLMGVIVGAIGFSVVLVICFAVRILGILAS